MDNHQITLSKTPLTIQIITSGGLVIAACTFVTLFFNRFIHVAPNLQSLLLIMLWIILPFLWISGSVLAFKKWPKATYFLTSDSLQVRKKGWFGAYSEQLYNYDDIVTLSSTNGAFGAYGTLTIALSQLEPIIIRAVMNPDQEALTIKEMISRSHTKVQVVTPE